MHLHQLPAPVSMRNPPPFLLVCLPQVKVPLIGIQAAATRGRGGGVRWTHEGHPSRRSRSRGRRAASHAKEPRLAPPRAPHSSRFWGFVVRPTLDPPPLRKGQFPLLFPCSRGGWRACPATTQRDPGGARGRGGVGGNPTSEGAAAEGGLTSARRLFSPERLFNLPSTYPPCVKVNTKVRPFPAM